MAVIATTYRTENFKEYRMRHLGFNVRVDIKIPVASKYLPQYLSIILTAVTTTKNGKNYKLKIKEEKY
jgi:hypothetical protein